MLGLAPSLKGTTLMLSKQLSEMLNEQITSELEASQIYLQMSLVCESLGLAGAGAFFRSHVSEEISHRDKLVDYMVESDAVVSLQSIDAPKADWVNLVEMLSSAYKHEQRVTDQIHRLARAALDEDDFGTFNMLQWFVAEQREEMMLFRDVTEYVRVTGFTGEFGDQMVNMDRYLAERAKEDC